MSFAFVGGSPSTLLERQRSRRAGLIGAAGLRTRAVEMIVRIRGLSFRERVGSMSVH